MATDQFNNPVDFTSDVTIRGTVSVSASQYLNSGTGIYPIPFEQLREATAFATVLPSAATSTFLGLVGGTIGTNGPLVTAGDLKAAGATTRSARFTFMLPPEYVAGGAVSLRASAGMQTTVADTSCNVDFQAYKLTRNASTPSADLVTTAATTCNSLTFADKTFTVTPTTLSPGDWLDVKVDLICTDAASGTAVTPTIGAIEVLCAVHG